MERILRITGGRVIDPASGRDSLGDVFAIDGVIAENLSDAQRAAAHTVDATGLVVAPGLIDIHVHFRDPGQTHKETIRSGSEAAAAGGFTTVICMPNTSPVCDNAGTIQRIMHKAEHDAVVRVHPTGCLTLGMEGEALAPTGQLREAGAVAMTDDGKCVQKNEIMRRAVEYADMFGLPIMDHCQDASLTSGAVMNEGEWSLKLGLRGWPSAAEDIIVARNVILADLTGARIHMQHISSAASVDILRDARSRGIPVSGEASPHHLTFTDACLADYDTVYKMNPPLRTEADRQALIEGLRDGTLGCVATDHAPHTPTEKDQEFDAAPFGVIGLETSLGATLEILHYEAGMALPEVLALMTCGPAKIGGLRAGTLAPGTPADICLFDPEEAWTVDPDRFFSRARNCPWAGRRLRGRVHTTIVGGKKVFDAGRIHV